MPYNGDNILLQGISADSETELVIQLLSVSTDSADAIAQPVPPEIQSILDSYPSVFTVPNSLPPKRAYDHAIPLVSGATPVNVRAYRYPPSLKDEIEAQVQNMLAQGLI